MPWKIFLNPVHLSGIAVTKTSVNALPGRRESKNILGLQPPYPRVEPFHTKQPTRRANFTRGPNLSTLLGLESGCFYQNRGRTCSIQ